MRYFLNIKNSAVSILEGMAVTLSWMFRRPFTIQWPDKIEKPLEESLPERSRGILEVETRVCTACLACQNACPIEVIAIDVDKDPETKQRLITRFDIDASKCMYCGNCVENCPTDAIRHTKLFACTNAHIENLVLRYVAAGEKIVPFKPKDPKPEIRPKGSIAASKLKGTFA